MRTARWSGPRFDLLVFVVAAGLIFLGGREVWAATQICTGSGANTNPKSMNCGVATCPGTPAVTCAAANPPPIPAGRGTFPPGHPRAGQRYAWCRCPAAPGNPPAIPATPAELETDCCHLVGVLNQDEDRIVDFDTIGSCIPCPLTGICKKATVNGQVEAYCGQG